jgi:hypothetical protein
MAQSPSHSVFVSYSSNERGSADAVCKALESRELSCWIAHRDNRAGESWDEGILDAIDSAKVMVLILSSHANASSMVKREVLRAAERNVPIIPFRTEDVEPGRALQFALSGTHWLDAFTGPVESNFDRLVTAVRQVRDGQPETLSERHELDVRSYLVSRGPVPYRAFMRRPRRPWSKPGAIETLSTLKQKLLTLDTIPRNPVEMRVTGTLFPSAVLTSGKWVDTREREIARFKWRDGLQKWLFSGFELWAPSWDFTWDFDRWNRSKTRRYFIAQLANGDEADSIPVVLPGSKATALLEQFFTNRGGFEAEVNGILGHRSHFLNQAAGESDPWVGYGNLLDYCLWLDEDQPKHKISPVSRPSELYSAYLWKCIGAGPSPAHGKQNLSDVCFIWEHTNLSSYDSVSYALDSLERKHEHISRKYGNSALIAKSSWLVPGESTLGAEHVYDALLEPP